MGLMLNFFRAYPSQTTLMLLALLLSGVAEGIGLSALLPMINIALGTEATEMLSGVAPASDNAFEQKVLDMLAYLGIAPTLGNMLGIMLFGVTLKSAFLLLAQRQVGYTAAQVGTDLRLQMLGAVLRSKWEYFLHQPVGRLTNALATEAQRSSAAFVNGATAITFLIQALVYGAVAFAISWRASLAAIVAGVVVIGLSHFLVRLTRKAGKRQTRLMSSLMANLTDTLQSVKPLKAMSREHLADQVLAHDTNQLNRALRRQVLYGAVLDSAQELMFTGFICLGVWVAIEKFDIDLAMVMVLVVALGRAFSFFGKVQKQHQKLAQGESAYWSLMASIDAATRAEEHVDGGVTPHFEQGLQFRDVVFGYDSQHPVFDGLCLDIKAGALTTLVGPSGSGKTTIIDLSIALLKPQEGAVLLDGVPLSEINIKQWRSMIGYVPQDTLLLHDSILHNVTLGDPNLDLAAAEEALRAAGAWDFVNRLPAGLDTIVGERGGKLSGGQRQRIVIARALINKPRLLILDEATSALDPESEEVVRQTMEDLKGRLTILAISHNRALVQAADHVYQMSAGSARLLDNAARAGLAK
ncbi:MAG: ABC transporter ATP-binding protein [Halieaceae bacterium]|jgi:ATP-binding cassette subfamily C protein|nr:ABC transporter ATP-binding protein [Halieaceae bacterium]